jgi:PAS domain S-box-containing protein
MNKHFYQSIIDIQARALVSGAFEQAICELLALITTEHCPKQSAFIFNKVHSTAHLTLEDFQGFTANGPEPIETILPPAIDIKKLTQSDQVSLIETYVIIPCSDGNLHNHCYLVIELTAEQLKSNLHKQLSTDQFIAALKAPLMSCRTYLLNNDGSHLDERENHQRNIRYIKQHLASFEVAKLQMQTDIPHIARIQKLTELACAALDVSRASVWLYSKDKTSIKCFDLFDTQNNQHFADVELFAKDYPVYFDAISENRIIVASDAYSSQETKEFAKDYLVENNIASMLDAPIILNGEIAGVLCHENRYSTREWSIDEQSFAKSVADSISIILDAQENQRIKQQLIKERDKFQLYLDTAQIMIIAIDKDANITLLNKKGQEFLEISEAEAIGLNWYQNFKVMEEVENNIKVFQRFIAGKQRLIEFNESWIVTRSGNKKLITWHNALLYDDDNNICGILSTGEDITAMREQEFEKAELEKQMHQLQKMHSLGQLTGGIAHDFNNILASILGYADLSSNLDLDIEANRQKLRKYLDIINSSGDRGRDLVAQMLAFSRSGNVEFELVDVECLIEESINMIRPMLPSTIKVDFDKKASPDKIFANENQLQQVLINLLVNARDAIVSHGEINIIIDLKPVKSLVCNSCHQKISGTFMQLTVKDSGSGIDPEIVNSIFDPFMTTKEVGKGTGMGLSSAHGIVHMHNGHISVDSTPNEGSQFDLYLPMANELAQQVTEVNQSPTINNPLASTVNLAIIDDEVAVAIMLKEVLSSYNFNVTTFENSAEGVQAICSDDKPFDMVITDYTMPEMTGIDAMKLIHAVHPEIPIILCSGNFDSISIKPELQKHFVAFFEKPLKLQEFANSAIKIAEKNIN